MMKTTLSLIIGILLVGNIFAEWTVVPPSPPPVEKKGFKTTAAVIAEFETIQKQLDHPDTVIIEDVPAFNWTNGCTATAAGMLIGYYDRHGFPDLYTGLVNNGVCPLTVDEWVTRWGVGTPGLVSFIASKQGVDGQVGLGHIDDYYTYTGTEDDPYHRLGREPRLRPDLLEGDCLADFMGTNQFWTPSEIYELHFDGFLVNPDGSSAYEEGNGGAEWGDTTLSLHSSTTFGDATFGIKNYIESKGYIVESYGNQAICNELDRLEIYNTYKIFFNNYQEEIDNNRPVIIHLVGHSVLGIGYNSTLNIVFIHDTWDNKVHSMEWDGAYGNYVDERGARLNMKQASFIRMSTSSTNVNISTNLTTTDTDLVTPFRKVTVEKDEANTITAVNTSIKTFQNWEVTGDVIITDLNAANTTFTATGPGTIKAIYFQDPASIITLVVDSNMPDIDTTLVTPFGTLIVDINTATSLVATNSDTREFTGWEVTGSVSVADSLAESTTFTATGDGGNITALYKEIIQPNTEIEITANFTTPLGLVTPYGKSIIKKGQSYEITANNNASSIFQYWETTGSVTVADIRASTSTFIATEDGAKIQAIYKQLLPLNIKRLMIKVDTNKPDRDIINLRINHRFGAITKGKLIINDFEYNFANIEWNKSHKISKDIRINNKRLFSITFKKQNLELFNTKNDLKIRLVIDEKIYQVIKTHQSLKLSQTWKAKDITGQNIFIKRFRATYRMSRYISTFKVNLVGSDMQEFLEAPVFTADSSEWQLIEPVEKKNKYKYKSNTRIAKTKTRCNYYLLIDSIKNKFTYRFLQKADQANNYRHFIEDQTSVTIEFSDGSATSSATIPCTVKQIIRL